MSLLGLVDEVMVLLGKPSVQVEVSVLCLGAGEESENEVGAGRGS